MENKTWNQFFHHQWKWIMNIHFSFSVVLQWKTKNGCSYFNGKWNWWEAYVVRRLLSTANSANDTEYINEHVDNVEIEVESCKDVFLRWKRVLVFTAQHELSIEYQILKRTSPQPALKLKAEAFPAPQSSTVHLAGQWGLGKDSPGTMMRCQSPEKLGRSFVQMCNSWHKTYTIFSQKKISFGASWGRLSLSGVPWPPGPPLYCPCL